MTQFNFSNNKVDKTGFENRQFRVEIVLLCFFECYAFR